MESQEVFKDFGVSNEDLSSSSENGGGLEQVNVVNNGFEQESYGNGCEQLSVLEQASFGNGISDFGEFETGKGNLADEVLEDLEEYWEDINDRLMISRMVSDSIIKGMVTAVEQEAAERVETKELEVANLKESLQSHDVVSSTFEAIRLNRDCGKLSSSIDAFVKNDKMREALQGFRNAAKEQFKQVEKEIRCIRGYNSIKKSGSGVGLVGLGGILQDNECKNSQDINKILKPLKTSVDTVFVRIDDILQQSKISLCEWQQVQDVSGKLEDTVMQSVIKSLHEEYEEKLWEQQAQFYGSRDEKWLEKFNEISSLRTQLDAIAKSLSITETGLVSHGSHDLDHLHRKAFSNHVSLPTSLSEGNGQLEAFKVNVHESYDFHQLKHLSKEDMVKYFNGIITEIRRYHESAIQQRTEEYFSLKRDYLNERRSYVTHRKDEEFNVLREKIPEVMKKLDCFLSENKRFPAMINNAESVVKLKGEIESLRFDNCQLRDTLSNKESELKFLEVQLADITGKLMQQYSNDVNMLKLVASLKSSEEDLCMEASLTEEVHKCAMKELIRHIRSNSEDSIVELAVMRKVYSDPFIEASFPAEICSRCEIDDSDIEPLILQELSGMVFKDAIKDAMERLKDLYQELLSEKKIRNSLQIKVLKMESELKLEVEEKENLKEHILNLDKEMEHKKESVMDLSISLSKEREQFELASQEVRKLKENIDQQQMVISASNNVKVQLMEAMQKIELDKAEIHNLTQKLDQTKKDLTEAIEQRNTALSLAQERQDRLILREASGEKQNMVIEAVTVVVNGMSNKLDDFECRILGMIKKNNLRLEDVSSNLKSLTEIANEFRRSGLTYRCKLERRCADLQKAEAEVDLLGDEVDTLLRLLEKIYVALDHYLPILKHYSGIIEILELVRRELSGESIKLL
ncbi:WPP domain-associated protein-like [Primulina huaijiensis]|uniref:WPP domain-associated protein-like n=1 Tax=Primulina huaijiensis TaxID=1492673 RepID=UPI003CC77FE8